MDLTDEEIERRVVALVEKRDKALRDGGRRASNPDMTHGRSGSVLPCEICGAPVVQGGGKTRLRCARCGKVYDKIYKRYSVTRTRAYAKREEERKAAQARGEVVAAEPAQPKPTIGKCKYCGKVNVVNKHGYCRECVEEGLNLLHQATGRTNGWDAKPKKKVLAKGGWRGRPCAGGRAHDFDQFRVALGVSRSVPMISEREMERRRRMRACAKMKREEEERQKQNNEVNNETSM